MLTKWIIGNFKSIAEKTSLELAPLTLICGANNSGKSTILQSMLAVAQTFSSGSRTRHLVLNGCLTRLGNFADLTHAMSDPNSEMEIGFTLHHTTNSMHVPEEMTLDLTVVGSGDLKEKKHTLTLPKVKRYEIGVRWPQGTGGDRYSDLALEYNPHDIRPDFEYQITQFEGFSSRGIEVDHDGDIGPTHFSINGLVPTGMLMKYNWAARRAAENFKYLISIVSGTDTSKLPQSLLAKPVPHDSPIWDLLYEVSRERRLLVKPELSELLQISSEQVLTWNDLLRAIRHGRSITLDRRGQPREPVRWTSEGRSGLRDRLLGSKDEWLKDIEEKKPRKGYEPRNTPDLLQKTASYMRAFWADRFLYIGPLRDDPKVIFAAPTDIERRSVGIKGEFAAAVLTEWGNTEVKYPLPPMKGNGTSLEYRESPLTEAVVLWLRHMGLVDRVRTQELAKIGYQLTVRSAGLEKPLDLMNVGVGVSQVLPTLVMSLIAPQDSTLIFEQPELHLHPRVQSILGDFLLGIAAMGKQCLVETHSEHLINRVRRRIAEAEGESVMKLTRIYFAEKPDIATKIISVEPNEYGAIPDWPKGFFDETADETELIIQAATRKRNLKLERKREALHARRRRS